METVSGALGGEDPAAMSLAELAVALGELGEDESVAQYRWLPCLAEFDRRQGWAADGALSCVDWLTRRCGLARRTAQERVRMRWWSWCARGGRTCTCRRRRRRSGGR